MTGSIATGSDSYAAAPEGRLRRLVEPIPNLSEPVWSPDGTALAVSRRG